MIIQNININKLYPDQLLLTLEKHKKMCPVTDSIEKFQKNLETQPDDWYYRTHSVNYTYNANNYRCPEWEDINWSDSWVMLGCSNVEGIGLDEEDTLPNQISKILGSPVINLGIGGSGPDSTLFNTLRLIDSGIRPKGVILLVGEFAWARLALFGQERVHHLGSWSLASDRHNWKLFSIPDFYKQWVHSPLHAETHSYMCDRGATAAWKAENVPTFHFNIELQLPKIIDRARDLVHPGRETVKIWAKTIVDTISQSSPLE